MNKQLKRFWHYEPFWKCYEIVVILLFVIGLIAIATGKIDTTTSIEIIK